MLIRSTRINGIRVCIFKTKKLGAYSYAIVKYNLDGTVATRTESRFMETANGIFNQICSEENEKFSRELSRDVT